jgi:hypothetical protein
MAQNPTPFWMPPKLQAKTLGGKRNLYPARQQTVRRLLWLFAISVCADPHGDIRPRMFFQCGPTLV